MIVKRKLSVCLIALGVFASCSNDVETSVAHVGHEVETCVKISLPESIITRGIDVPAAFVDPELTDVNVTLFISYNGKISKTITKEAQDFTNGKTVEFTTRLVAGQTYDISAWADFGQGCYSLHSTVGDTAYVEIDSTVFKSLESDIAYNKFDAYFGNIRESININKSLLLTLNRPFALVMINTMDWNDGAVKNAGLRPDNYFTTFRVPTRMRLIDGALSKVRDIVVAGYVTEYDQDGTPKELSFDYLFADTVSSILPAFTVNYRKNADNVTSYTFSNIPVQRNFKTIITGNVLTNEGTVKVSVDGNWNTPDFVAGYRTNRR